MLRWLDPRGRKLKGKENYVHNSYSSSNISVTRPRMMRWARHVAGLGGDEKAVRCDILIGNLQRKRLPGSSGQRVLYNIKAALQEIV
jgi:hypothetical protein